ncbi:MAG: nitronate monooxygenase [Bacteroidetes bacterium]|nr:nitronate monooxygenase [Bacteroidota bacterium]
MTSFSNNRVCKLLNIQFPIIQAGMIWASGWKLASAVSNAGALGVIGAGSMYPENLDHHIKSCKEATNKPFGVNLPLLYKDIEKHIDIILKNGVKIVITSAGNPATFTHILKNEGITVIHVVSSSKFAQKAELCGCDAVIAEGFEAGGHNGREETTSFILTPIVSEAVAIPVIAAGGIATGRQMLAAMVLGAEGVQVGSRFVASDEASSHINFKNAILKSAEGDTILSLKELTPVRLLKNQFYEKIKELYHQHASTEQLRTLLGNGRAKKGMFEGDLENGELEIGQVSALIHHIQPASYIVTEIVRQFEEALQNPLK